MEVMETRNAIDGPRGRGRKKGGGERKARQKGPSGGKGAKGTTTKKAAPSMGKDSKAKRPAARKPRAGNGTNMEPKEVASSAPSLSWKGSGAREETCMMMSRERHDLPFRPLDPNIPRLSWKLGGRGWEAMPFAASAEPPPGFTA
jgi:hypothetical protein